MRTLHLSALILKCPKLRTLKAISIGKLITDLRGRPEGVENQNGSVIGDEEGGAMPLPDQPCVAVPETDPDPDLAFYRAEFEAVERGEGWRQKESDEANRKR